MRKRMIARYATLAAIAVLAACNTIEGVGKDVKSAGEAVEKAAN
jgi:predicted small secreted protein